MRIGRTRTRPPRKLRAARGRARTVMRTTRTATRIATRGRVSRATGVESACGAVAARGAAAGARARLTEAQLSALWRGQRFPAGALVTRQGVPVRVIFPGRPGRGAGPDYRGAVIAGPSGAQARGDVELHVRSSLFRVHGHEADRAYAGVVLHVVFEDDTGEDTPLPGGGRAPVVALAPWVAARASELEHWLARPLLWREPCHGAVARMGIEGVMAALDAEGARRLEAKTDAFAARIGAEGLEQALYAGLLTALGYGGNTGQMAALARLLPWPRLRDAVEAIEAAAGEGTTARCAGERDRQHDGGGACDGDRRRRGFEALLLGSAGLLPSQRVGARGPSPPLPAHPYVAAIEALFGAAGLPSLGRSGWRLAGIRPENAPARRLAGAAALLAGWRSPADLLLPAAAARTEDAVAPLCVAGAGFWRDQFDLCASPCRLPPAIIGRSRAIEIVINVVLPAALAVSRSGAADGAMRTGAFVSTALGAEPWGGEADAASMAGAFTPAAPYPAELEATALETAAISLYGRLPRPAAYGATRLIETAIASGADEVRAAAAGTAGEGGRPPRVRITARRAQGLLGLHRDWCNEGGCGRCPLS